MSRTPLIAGNWKMYKTGPEAVKTARDLAQLCSDVQDVEVMIAPTFLSLPMVSEVVKDTNVKLGAQNLYYEKQGAFTGEISADMLKVAGVEYVIIGHSERRQYFGETDEVLAKKTERLLDNDIKPIFCIGEVLDDREAGKQFEVVEKQLNKGVFVFNRDEFSNIILAYEPVWAIGTGKTATSEQAQEMHAYIRQLIEKKYDAETAENTTILYGGSCNPKNAKELFANPDVDGGLIGGASLKADDFAAIIDSI